MYVALHQIQMWAQDLSENKSEINPKNPNHKLLIKNHQQVYTTSKTKVHIQVTNHICLLLLIKKKEILLHIVITLCDSIIPTCNSALHMAKKMFKHNTTQHNTTQHITLKLLLLLHYFLSKMVHFKLMRSVKSTTQCKHPRWAESSTSALGKPQTLQLVIHLKNLVSVFSTVCIFLLLLLLSFML
jgi:hypothetical protein